MIRPGRARASLALLAAVGLGSADSTAGRGDAAPPASAAITGVELIPPDAGDTLRSVTPTFTIRTIAPQPADRPIVLGLQIAYNPGFTIPLLVDTTVTADTTAITLRRALPGGARVYVRASARTASGEVVLSPWIERVVPPWLVLVSPNDPNGSTLETPRPRFVWRSPRIADAVGPWIYDLEIRNVGSGQSTFYANLSDTTFTPTAPLNLNTSYRWSVTARMHDGDAEIVESEGSFVIVNPAFPMITLLYQNFPNPFPNATSNSTCIWFDLHAESRVALDVFDLSGRHVRNIVPGRDGISQYFAGRHGRAPGGPVTSGCNGDLQWDGRGDDGAFVPAGVYLVRLRAAGVESVRKIVFRGRP